MERVRVWGLLTASGVVAVCLWQLLTRSGPSVDSAVSWIVRGSVFVAIVAAVAVAGLGFISRRRGARRARQEQVLAQLHAAVGRVLDEGGHTVQVARWAGTMPVKIRVDLPRGLSIDDLSTRMSQEVGKAISAEGGPRRWQARRLPLRAALVLSPRPSSTSEDQREAASDRVVTLLKKTLPGARSVRVTQWGEADAPAVIVATFDPNPRLSSTAVETAILRVVGDNFPGRWSAHWEREKDRVTFELKPGLPQVIDRPHGMSQPAELDLRYGVTADGEVQSWRPGGSAPHCLVIGPTGGGKTFALRAMALDAISQGMIIHGCDPKMIELVGFIGVPGVGEIATEPEEIAELIADMYQLMMRRYADLRALRVRREELQPILLIIDEFFILRMRLQRAHKENDGKGEHPALGMVAELLALARSARIHLVIGIQRPDAEFLTGAARDNLRHRLSLSQLSPKGAEMMWGDQITGTDLPAIPGRAVATSQGGSPTEIQVYRVPDPDPRLRAERTPEEMAVLEQVFATASQKPAAAVKELPALSEAGDVAVEEDQDGVEISELDEPSGGGDIPPAVSELERASSETSGVWVQASVESLMPEDVIVLDGAEITLVDVDEDPMDEDYVLLAWEGGSVSMPADDAVSRRQTPVAA